MIRISIAASLSASSSDRLLARVHPKWRTSVRSCPVESPHRHKCLRAWPSELQDFKDDPLLDYGMRFSPLVKLITVISVDGAGIHTLINSKKCHADVIQVIFD